MRNYQVRKLLILILTLIFLFIEVKSSCFDNPFDSCQCKIAVNKWNECVDECRSSEVMIDFSPKKSFKRCGECSEAKLYLNSNNDKCVISCPMGEITIEGNYKCSKSFDNCPSNYYRSEARQSCSSSCQKNRQGDFVGERETIDETTQIKSCISCPYIYPYDTYYGDCEICQATEVEATGECSYIFGSECKGYLSSDESFCWKDSCKKNEYPLKQSNYENKCAACQNNKPYISQDRKNCVKECAPNEFTDQYNKQCLTNIESCTGYVSSDRKTCSYRCQKSEIPTKRKIGQSYIQCQKCPSDLPIVDNTLLKCVSSCNLDEYIQEKYNTCLLKESYCSNDYEKQVILRNQKKCLSNCPAQHIYTRETKYNKNLAVCIQCQFYERAVDLFTDQDGEVFKLCLERCFFPQIFDKVKNECILCHGFVFEKQCYETCPENKLSEIVYSGQEEGLIYERKDCVDSCKNTFQQSDSNECKSTCKEGEVKDLKNYKCIKKEDCKEKISLDLQYCTQKCETYEYVLTKDGVNYCQICFDYFLDSNSESSSPQCLKQCPKDFPMIKTDYDQKSCISKYDCNYPFKTSTSYKYCTKSCERPDFFDNQYSIWYNYCSSSCIDKNNIITYNLSSDQFECDKVCKDKMSSNNKYCLHECIDLYEAEKDKVCVKCENDQYQKYEEFSNKFICVNNKFDKNELQLILNSLQKLLNKNRYITQKEQYDFYTQQIQTILTEFQDFLQDYLNKFVKIIFYMLNLLQRDFNKKQIIFQTSETVMISQRISQNYENNFSKSFSYSSLMSDKPELTIQSSQFGIEPDYNPFSLLVFISQQNILCPEIYSSYQCLYNIEVIIIIEQTQKYQPFIKENRQTQSTEFTIFFDIDEDRNINKYVCLTTIDKRTKRSIKTEVSSNPQGINCTFKDNVTLFFDSQNQYRECPQNQPYKLINKCVKECPQLLDPVKQKCVSSLKECTFVNENGKQCVSECSGEFEYKYKISDNNIICQKECKKKQIPFQDESFCLDGVQCKFYLVDNSYCSYYCPVGNIITKKNQNPYFSCDNKLKPDETQSYGFIILIVLIIICIIVYLIIMYLKQQGNNILQNILPSRQAENQNQQQADVELVTINQNTQLLRDYDQNDQNDQKDQKDQNDQKEDQK